jgi:hypothetical protein
VKKALASVLIGAISVLSLQILSMQIASGKPRLKQVSQGQKEVTRRQQQMKVRKVQREIIRQGI